LVSIVDKKLILVHQETVFYEKEYIDKVFVKAAFNRN
jgi:hypothetical protein